LPGAFCPVPVDTAALVDIFLVLADTIVDIFYLVPVETATVVASDWRKVYKAETVFYNLSGYVHFIIKEIATAMDILSYFR